MNIYLMNIMYIYSALYSSSILFIIWVQLKNLYLSEVPYIYSFYLLCMLFAWQYLAPEFSYNSWSLVSIILLFPFLRTLGVAALSTDNEYMSDLAWCSDIVLIYLSLYRS